MPDLAQRKPLLEMMAGALENACSVGSGSKISGMESTWGKRPLCLAGLGRRVQSHPQVVQSLCPPTFQCFW